MTNTHNTLLWFGIALFLTLLWLASGCAAEVAVERRGTPAESWRVSQEKQEAAASKSRDRDANDGDREDQDYDEDADEDESQKSDDDRDEDSDRNPLASDEEGAAHR